MSKRKTQRTMTPQDKQLIEEIIKNVRAEVKYSQSEVKIHLEQILEQTIKTNGRVTKIESETAIWRWFERKPGRFVLIVIFFLALTAEGMRSIIEQLM